MMLRLLERYVIDDEGGTSGDVVGRERQLESIRTHLVHLFSLRRGSVRCNADLGLPDSVLDGAPFSAGTGTLTSLLASVVRSGEPRLLACRVEASLADGDAGVRVTVFGRMVSQRSNGEEIILSGSWDDHGMFHVD